GVAEPIKPALILPEVTDLSKWKDGHIDFADKAEVYNIVSFVNPKAMIFYNKNLVDPKKLTSYKDLLSPEWKGKLVSFDPTSAGSGLATFTFYYTNPALGEDFIRQLAGQGIRTTRDQDQVVRWVAEGAAAIAIAFGEDNATPLIKAGAPVGIIQTLKEGGYFTTGSTSLLLMNRAPHPNAAKVFVNWFLSKDGATAFGTAVGWNTRRVDIPQDYIPEYGRIAPGVKYDETNYKEDMVYRKDEIAAVVRKYLQQ
ncbi:MAG TPA: extracellular solute-binding protein, partial [Dehalococcoidia bacterium]|nr:extracellular solute-binding protein [Dehalococcoidia bacterium]